MKQKLLIFFYFVMSQIGIIRLFYYLNRQAKIVLTYHHIIPDELFDSSVQLGMSHCVSTFEKHIRIIKRRFSDTHINQKILISFDDGYLNQYQIASKILETHGFRGIFFITFELIEKQIPLTIDRIMQWVSYVPIGNYPILNLDLVINAENRYHIASILYDTLLLNYLLWNTIEETLNAAFPFSKLKMNAELKTNIKTKQ